MGLCCPKALMELGKEVRAVLRGDNSARPPISRIRAALNQVRCLEVVEEIGHDRAVDAEVLGQGELAPNGALGGRRQHLVAAWTARKVGNGMVRSSDVGPKQSAQTVLSTQDPVRVFTQFATLDAVSNGRAQLILGRGSLTESFPLFGFDLSDYEELFEENLDLFTPLLRDQPVTWSGKFRSPLTNQYLSPPLPQGHLPTWVGVGGSPQSVVRAARHGLPLMLAVIGGPPIRFAPLVDLYGRALETYGYPQLAVGMHSHGFIAKTDEEAADIQYPHWAHVFENAAAERGWARPTMEKFQAEIAEGSLYLGSPEIVATKIAWVIRLLGLSRFDLAYATGRVPHEQKMATIELYGREVIPRVREILADVVELDSPTVSSEALRSDAFTVSR